MLRQHHGKMLLRFLNRRNCRLLHLLYHLKHSGISVNAIRIRFPASPETPPLEPLPVNLSSGDTPGSMSTVNQIANAPASALFALELGPIKEPGNAPKSCAMDVDVDALYQKETESILLNEHGEHIRTWG